jgi:BirA family biotin operon repressor/biotin-[acetyl-CoA-carboxylase] ligase
VSGAQPPAGTPTSTSIGHPRVHLRRTGSTNERARELAFAGAPNGTLVTASEQTAGRGRQGRRWSAPAGSSVLMSLLLRSPPPLLPLIAAVALCDVADASSPAGEQARIKWPNDVVLDNVTVTGAGLAKLAGILVEGRPQEGWAVLGIGLNVAVRIEDLPAELRSGSSERTASSSGLPAATLGLAPADVEATLTRSIDALERRLAEPAEATLREWRARDALRGREIEWAEGRGRADGIDGTGRLMVVLANGGRTALSAGEVHLRQIS